MQPEHGRRRTAAILSLGLLAAPAWAHHSYAAFDRNKVITITGAVRTWEMGNPHAYLWIFVPDGHGGQDIWGLEAPAPNTLIARGFDKYTLKVGDQVTAKLNPLRDGRHGGNLMELKLADGRVLSAGPPPAPNAPSEAPAQQP